jgi:hypothetical protein
MAENRPGTAGFEKKQVGKSAGRPFEKGQSGNPGGRPKVEGEIRALAQEHGPEALKRLVQLMKSKNERVAVAAAQAVLDRGYGKPPQAVQLGGQDGSSASREILIHFVGPGDLPVRDAP